MLFDLSGRTALVTGATGHLGQQICRALGSAGAHVLANARSAEKAADFVSQCRVEGISAEATVFDITDPDAVAACAAARADSALHILVNNAYGGSGGTVESSSPEAFGAAYDIAVTAAHRLLRAMLPALRRGRVEAGDASVINVASMYGMVSPDLRAYATPEGSNPPFYGAAKAALIQYTRYAACEFGPEGLRVNALAPGPFPSAAVQQDAPGFVKTLADRVPMGRIGQAGEIGGPVVFLAAPAATFVTGAVLPVDGGWTAW